MNRMTTNWRINRVERVKHLSYLLEAVAFSALVALYIWRWQAEAPRSWWVIAVWLGLSVLLRRDTPKTLGWRADNLWSSARKAFPYFTVASLAVCGVGLFLGMLHRLPVHLLDFRRFTGYLAFCLLQQVGLNSLVTNRLLSYFRQPWPAAILAGLLFAALHWPNPVLVPLTLIGGVGMAWLFARDRNILPLALGQAVLGALVWWAFPLAWHHSMRVGPGYHTYHF
jgi:membrane protease YdiL (CAAX protease family)